MRRDRDPPRTPDRPRHVLLLYAESRLLPAIVSADEAFRSTVASGLGAPVVFHTEFLDLPSTPSPAYERRVSELLRLKYKGAHLDLIVALAASALRFAIDLRPQLAPALRSCSWPWSRPATSGSRPTSPAC